MRSQWIITGLKIIDPDEMPLFDARAEAMSRAWGTSASLFQKLKLVPELIKRL